MRPMVNRIAQKAGHSLGKLVEFFLVGSFGARAEFFLDAVGAHCAPLVVVAAEPNLGDIVPLLVVQNFVGRKVAVEIDNGGALGKLIEKGAGGFGFKKEIVVNKFFHRCGF